MTLGQNVCPSGIPQPCLKVGQVGLKARSLGKILEKSCLRSRGHIFCSILLKFDQNVRSDDILNEFKNGSYQIKNYISRSNLTKT